MTATAQKPRLNALSKAILAATAAVGLAAVVSEEGDEALTGAAADAVSLAEEAGRRLLSRASPALLAEIRA